MHHSNKRTLLFFIIGLASSIAVIGCSSKPTQDELTQLDNVRSEIKSLEQRKSSLQQEQTTLQQSVAEKEVQLRTCQNDQTAVKAKLHE